VLHPPDAPELVVSVLHDITDSEHIESLRDQFFAAAAHSLKTPVAIIKANAQLLSRGAGPHPGKSMAASDRQCGRIDRLIQNLLVLSRARSRTLQLAPLEVALAPVVEQESGTGLSRPRSARSTGMVSTTRSGSAGPSRR
jgi:signal transduction histidine kinase